MTTNQLSETDRLLLANASLLAAKQSISRGIKLRLTADFRSRRATARREFRQSQAARRRRFASTWKAEQTTCVAAVATATAEATTELDRQLQANARRLDGLSLPNRRTLPVRRWRLIAVAGLLAAGGFLLLSSPFSAASGAAATPVAALPTVCGTVPDSSGTWVREHCADIAAAASDPAVTPFITSGDSPKQTAFAFLPSGLDYLYQVTSLQQARPELAANRPAFADAANPTTSELTALAVEVNSKIHATLVLDARNVPDPDASVAAFVAAWYGPDAPAAELTPLFQTAWQS